MASNIEAGAVIDRTDLEMARRKNLERLAKFLNARGADIPCHSETDHEVLVRQVFWEVTPNPVSRAEMY